MYIIIRGQCEIVCKLKANEKNPFYPEHFRHRATKLSELGEGVIFGESGFFTQKKQANYTVRALTTNVTLFSIRYVLVQKNMELILPFLRDFFLERE